MADILVLYGVTKEIKIAVYNVAIFCEEFKMVRKTGIYDEEDLFSKSGHISGEEEAEKRLFSPKYRRLNRYGYTRPISKSSRPVNGDGLCTFYYSDKYICKEVSITKTEPSKGREFLYPLPSQVKEVKELGGRYDRNARCYSISSDAISKYKYDKYANDRNKAMWEGRLGKNTPSSGTAMQYQSYIERLDHKDRDRERELYYDNGEAVEFGNIGNDDITRRNFWKAVEDIETSGGRIQRRIIAEVPHELVHIPGAIKKLVKDFTSQVFESRNLPYFVVVHRPHIEEGSDVRNIHIHIAYHDRPLNEPIAGNRVKEFKFADKKLREVCDSDWILSCRTLYGKLAAELQYEYLPELITKDKAEFRIFSPLSYKKLGINKDPGEHLSTRQVASERAGVPTAKGVRNALKEYVFKASMIAKDKVLANTNIDIFMNNVEKIHSSSSKIYALAKILEEKRRKLVDLLYQYEEDTLVYQRYTLRSKIREDWAILELAKANETRKKNPLKTLLDDIRRTSRQNRIEIEQDLEKTTGISLKSLKAKSDLILNSRKEIKELSLAFNKMISNGRSSNDIVNYIVLSEQRALLQDEFKQGMFVRDMNIQLHDNVERLSNIRSELFELQERIDKNAPAIFPDKTVVQVLKDIKTREIFAKASGEAKVSVIMSMGNLAGLKINVKDNRARSTVRDMVGYLEKRAAYDALSNFIKITEDSNRLGNSLSDAELISLKKKIRKNEKELGESASRIMKSNELHSKAEAIGINLNELSIFARQHNRQSRAMGIG